MHRTLDIDLIFPIRDKSSAQLMALKPDACTRAGVIDDDEEELVLRKAARTLHAPDDELVLARREFCAYGIKADSHRPTRSAA